MQITVSAFASYSIFFQFIKSDKLFDKNINLNLDLITQAGFLDPLLANEIAFFITGIN